MRKVVNDDVDEACTNTGQKIVAKKAISAPHEFELAAKHPKREHVQDDVPNIGYVVQEEVGEWLPDAESGKNACGDQAEPFEEPAVAGMLAETGTAAIAVD